MAKFYITDGNIQMVTDKPTMYLAVGYFISSFINQGYTIGKYIHVNERGFENTEIRTDQIFNADDFLCG